MDVKKLWELVESLYFDFGMEGVTVDLSDGMFSIEIEGVILREGNYVA